MEEFRISWVLDKKNSNKCGYLISHKKASQLTMTFCTCLLLWSKLELINIIFNPKQILGILELDDFLHKEQGLFTLKKNNQQRKIYSLTTT